jgi:hypothetical protein
MLNRRLNIANYLDLSRHESKQLTFLFINVGAFRAGPPALPAAARPLALRRFLVLFGRQLILPCPTAAGQPL